ncbi:MAG TPA: hypothetical protein PKN36_06430, partial [bacterium]|nr:hypothetical protein [bacterium]
GKSRTPHHERNSRRVRSKEFGVKEVITMCKCCCGSGKKEEKIYECKKCGKTSKVEKYCCGQMMKERK